MSCCICSKLCEIYDNDDEFDRHEYMNREVIAYCTSQTTRHDYCKEHFELCHPKRRSIISSLLSKQARCIYHERSTDPVCNQPVKTLDYVSRYALHNDVYDRMTTRAERSEFRHEMDRQDKIEAQKEAKKAQQEDKEDKRKTEQANDSYIRMMNLDPTKSATLGGTKKKRRKNKKRRRKSRR
jgi:hypothetical protein